MSADKPGPLTPPEALLQATPSLPEQKERPAESKPGRKPTDLAPSELIKALEQHHWDLKAAAAFLGVSRTSLYYWIDRNPEIRLIKDLDDEEISASFKACGGDLKQMVTQLRVSEIALRRRLAKIQGLD